MEINNWLNNLRLGAKNSTALVVHGPSGSGKSVAIKHVEKLARFNVPARHVKLGDFGNMFFLDSVYRSPLLSVDINTNDHTLMMITDHIKPLLTESQLRVDRMGKSTVNVANNINLIIHADARFVEQFESERRFVFVQPMGLIAIANEVF